MEEKKKNILDVISQAWNWLEGKKRRIAFVSGAIMQITKEHTLAHQIALVGFWLFGGADIAQNSSKILKDKLPTGLRK